MHISIETKHMQKTSDLRQNRDDFSFANGRKTSDESLQKGKKNKAALPEAPLSDKKGLHYIF